MILNAAVTCSSVALPPTSRKFAGWPPKCLMMSIVAIARPAPLTMQPMLPSSLMNDEVVALGLDLRRVLLVEVAQRLELLLAVERVVVEGHLGVERQHAAVLEHDQRVDLDQRGVGRR